MLKKSLLSHIDTPCAAVHAFQVELARKPEDQIMLRYRLAGDVTSILIPEPKPSLESDGLWRHTCFELFVGQRCSPAYYEFNFSPSGQWAAYAFSAYRERRPWTIGRPPDIAVTQSRNELLLTARITAAELLSDSDAHSFQLGVSAVVESITGDLSYWALHHPCERPDFHDRSSFVCTL